VLKPARESVERQLGALLGKSLERRRKNLDVSSKREPAEAPGEISPYL
jgi:hypothetical protein